eukprot:COSAG06_NODE_43_length_29826_cov_32.009621_3_plen_98_part_00
MRDWAAARSPGNGHLGGGVPRKRPPRPPVAPYAGNGHRGWGGLRKTATPRVYVNRSHSVHIAPTQESMQKLAKKFFPLGHLTQVDTRNIDQHTQGLP